MNSGLKNLVLTDLADAAFDEGFEGGPDRDRARKIALCFHFHSLLQSDEPTIDVCFGMVWVNFDGLIEVGQCSMHISLSSSYDSAIVVRHNITRIAFQRFVEVGQRSVQVTFVEPKVTSVVQRRRQSRNDL